MTRPALPRRASRGLSMIEVLVVLVLFSFALIGVVGLQARAVQNSVSAEDFNRAAMLANEMASAMWTSNTVVLPPATISTWNTAVGDPTGRGLPNGADDKCQVKTQRWLPSGGCLLCHTSESSGQDVGIEDASYGRSRFRTTNMTFAGRPASRGSAPRGRSASPRSSRWWCCTRCRSCSRRSR